MRVKRTARDILVFLIVSSQLLLGVLAPTLVVCQEGSGAQILELSLSFCCAADTAPTEGAEQVQVRPQDDCGDCEDGTFVVSLKDGERPLSATFQSAAFLSAVFPIDHPAWSWEACAPPLPARTPNAWPGRELKALRTVHLRC